MRSASATLPLAAFKYAGLAHQALERRNLARRGFERSHERFPALGIEPEMPAIGERLLGARQRAFEHEFAHRASGGRGRYVERPLGLGREPEVQFFATGCLHSSLLPRSS